MRQVDSTTSFNSTLVRFKVVSRRVSNMRDTCVSIPHWFDSKSAASARLVVSVDQCFNSTLVRFKVVQSDQHVLVAVT